MNTAPHDGGRVRTELGVSYMWGVKKWSYALYSRAGFHASPSSSGLYSPSITLRNWSHDGFSHRIINSSVPGEVEASTSDPVIFLRCNVSVSSAVPTARA